jgi:hypothetical protein
VGDGGSAPQLSDALPELAHDEAGVPVQTSIDEGDPAQRLLEHTHHEDLLVLGNRGRRPFAATLMGSVALRCAHQARCPVGGLSRQLAGELGPYGIRVVCLRPNGIPEAIHAGSHSGQVFARRAEILGISLDQFVEGFADGTLLKRSATLADVANVAAFMGSDQAQAMTATTANISAGSVVG